MGIFLALNEHVNVLVNPFEEKSLLAVFTYMVWHTIFAFMFIFTGKILELLCAIFALIMKFWMFFFNMNIKLFH